MNCRKVKLQLPDYIDGTIDQYETNEIAMHIRECRDCAEEIHFLTWYRKQLENVPRMNAPPNFLEQVSKRIANIKSSNKKRIFDAIFSPPLIKIPIQAAALATIVIITVMFIRLGIRDEESQRTPQDLSQTLSRDTEHKGREGAADYTRKDIATAPFRKEKEKASPLRTQPADRSTAKQVASGGPASPIVVYLSTYQPSSTTMKRGAVDENTHKAEQTLESAEDKISETGPSSTISEFDDTDYIIQAIRKANGKIIRIDYDAGLGKYRTIVTEMPAVSCEHFMDTLRSRWRMRLSTPAPCTGTSKVLIELHISN